MKDTFRINQLKFDDERQIVDDFLWAFTNKIIDKMNTHYCRNKTHIFTFAERQLNTVLIPALDYLTEGKFMCEVPIERKSMTAKKTSTDKKGKYTGWLDLLGYYGATNFLIEVKHGYLNLKSPNLKYLKELWQTVS